MDKEQKDDQGEAITSGVDKKSANWRDYQYKKKKNEEKRCGLSLYKLNSNKQLKKGKNISNLNHALKSIYTTNDTYIQNIFVSTLAKSYNFKNNNDNNNTSWIEFRRMCNNNLFLINKKKIKVERNVSGFVNHLLAFGAPQRSCQNEVLAELIGKTGHFTVPQFWSSPTGGGAGSASHENASVFHDEIQENDYLFSAFNTLLLKEWDNVRDDDSRYLHDWKRVCLFLGALIVCACFLYHVFCIVYFVFCIFMYF